MINEMYTAAYFTVVMIIFAGLVGNDMIKDWSTNRNPF